MTKILLKKSNVVVTDGVPKLPKAADLEWGEIAINYATGCETISLKNQAGDIVPLKFHGGGYVLTETDIINTKNVPGSLEDLEGKKDEYDNKPISAYNVCKEMFGYDYKIYTIEYVKIKGLDTRVTTNTNNIATNTKAISDLNDEFKISNETFQQFKSYVNNELDTIKNQLKGIETQTTSIISKEDDIITNAQ